MGFDPRKNFSENRGLWIFLGVALAVVVVLAVFVAPWASSSPDGLEKIAKEKGFMNKAEEQKPAWGLTPMKGYAVPGIKNEKASTGIAGLTGVLVTAALVMGLALLVSRLSVFKKRRATPGGVDDAELPTSET